MFFQLEQVTYRQLSENGKFLALSAQPYRGAPEGHVYSLSDNKLIARVQYGTAPVINKNGLWVGFVIKPSLLAVESTDFKGLP